MLLHWWISCLLVLLYEPMWMRYQLNKDVIWMDAGFYITAIKPNWTALFHLLDLICGFYWGPGLGYGLVQLRLEGKRDWVRIIGVGCCVPLDTVHLNLFL